MQETWSDTDSENSASITSEGTKYDPNDMLAFVAFIEYENESYCYSNSDDE